MKTTRRLLANAIALGLGATLWGCSTDTIDPQPLPGFIPNPSTSGVVGPKFDPGINPNAGLGDIPFPNDVLRDPATGLNTRVPAGSDPADSLRTLRGFSTTGNVIIPFDGQIDAASVNPQTVLFIQGSDSRSANEAGFANTTVPANITVTNPTGSGSTGTSTIVLQPKFPLKPITNYYVVITNQVTSNGRGVGNPKTVAAAGAPSVNTGLLTKSTTPLVDANGNSLVFPASNETAAELEALRSAYQVFWARAEQITGTSRTDIPFVFRFGTQPLFATLASPEDEDPADTSGENPPNGNPGLRALAAREFSGGSVNPGLVSTRTGPVPLAGGAVRPIPAASDNPQLGAAMSLAAYKAALEASPGGSRFSGVTFNNVGRIYEGRIRVRNYINPATGRFEGENLPVPGSAPFTQFGTTDVPFVAAYPDAAPFFDADPGPGTVIVPRVRPLVIYQHGLDKDKRDMFLVADRLCAEGFAVIAIDLFLHGELQVPGRPSGLGFINPTAMRNTRDNGRQSISNLFHVNEAVVAGRSDVDGFLTTAGGPAVPDFTTPFAPAPVNGPAPNFIGHSLGGIVGAPYAAVSPYTSRAALSAAGGRLAEMLMLSNRGPAIKSALASAGIVEGTDAYQGFMAVFQTVLDDVDALNYAAPGLLPTSQGGFKPNITSPPAPVAVGQQKLTLLLQEMTGDQTINNASTRDLARAYGQVDIFRHVEQIVAAVEGVEPVASGWPESGFYQFDNGFGHEAILGLDGDTTRKVINQIADFLGTPGQIIDQP
jgi:hypothetical protein